MIVLSPARLRTFMIVKLRVTHSNNCISTGIGSVLGRWRLTHFYVNMLQNNEFMCQRLNIPRLFKQWRIAKCAPFRDLSCCFELQTLKATDDSWSTNTSKLVVVPSGDDVIGFRDICLCRSSRWISSKSSRWRTLNWSRATIILIT